ncbi:MBL fold metallo-hydrolase [Pantoea phytobeneficialis]|uniref:MBL fold metallo-hydrolase n=1 Tax=Pantoea phytobeneficialis TaxID=2052056 RepID=A0AAP9H9E9_9GAMM|nr:MBL fold metallo-hydrolase [Pantoea phytobeneficialis]MDO6408744.1 MBL fold metallo-hydrolase [Pantoea phytobeneficialis]QGR08992.1 MBL fold metallo-hydrolase [Pantoea phytobeneficialis]
MKIQVGDCLIEKVTEQTATLPFAALYPDHLAQMPVGLAPQLATLSIHSWVVRTGKDIIIIDTATGNQRDRDHKPLFHQLQTDYAQRLVRAGVDPHAVTLVLMTHIHTDHVGWNTHWRDGRWQPMFPNARYICSAAELARCEKNPAMQALYLDSILPLINSGQLETVAVDGSPLFAGVLRYLPTPGHSIDHASLLLSSRGQQAFFSGDVMHHPLQFQFPRWNSVFCENKALAVRSRQLAIDWCLQHQAIWFSSHFSASSCGRVISAAPELPHWMPLEAEPDAIR